ncbi:MAG: motility protein A [Bacillota bacterium]
MQKTTLIGLVAGTAFIIISILISKGATLSSFWDGPSILIVVGGCIASTIVAYPAKTLKSLIPAIRTAFKGKKIDLQKDIDLIIEIANIARREGLLALDGSVGRIEDAPFLKKGIMLVIDGADPEFVKNVMEAEIYYVQTRHAQSQAVLDSLAAYAPAYGMIGTLIGLINMLKNLNDSASLGPSMAVALITTFYGVVLANLVFGPISKKLKVFTAEESKEMELLLDGLLSVQAGENPRFIRDRLKSFLARSEIGKEKEKETQRVEVKEIN